jgi:hypothetical protein
MVLAMAAFLTGCTRKPDPTDPPNPRPAGVRRAFPAVDRAIAERELGQIGLAYINCTDSLGHPPKNIDELAKFYERNSTLTDRLQKEPRLYKIYWDADPKAPGAILGYVFDVPKVGGVVLMTNGSTQVLSAEEFKATPKAGKRTKLTTEAGK